MANAPTFTASMFQQALMLELPTGDAWDRTVGGPLWSTCLALAQCYARNSAEAAMLIQETFPKTTLQLLPEWEESLGLPGPCFTGEETIPERVAAVVAKLTNRGGNTPAFYKAYCAQLGYTVDIQEFTPQYIGIHPIYQPIYMNSSSYSWVIRVYADGPAASLECNINIIKPAHTRVAFQYDNWFTPAAPIPMPIVDGSNAVSDSLPIVGISNGTFYTIAPTFSSSVVMSINATTSAPTALIEVGGTYVPSVAPMLRLSTSGKNIVDSTGSTVRLKSVNWFGAQSTNMCPDGLWSVSYQSILTNIKSFGFNCIRMPICVDFCQSGAMPTSINTYANPALAGLNAVQVMQTVVSYAGSLSLYVYLDMHRFNGGAGTDSDINSTTIGSIVSAWQTMATAFGSNSTVIGCDVYNEPYTLDWPTFASYAVTIGNAVHAIAPDWLIIVEGVGGTGTGGIPGFWWGGNLTGVSTHPVVLSASNKVVYSPHEYGQSVGAQSWLETTSQVVSLYPTNLPSIWNPSWGFINEDNIAPILIGEFGGKLGYTGSGSTDSTQVNATYEQEWLAELASYVNTYGMSFTYWAYNPNSGDTGGLMCDDWVTPQLGKLALLSSLI